MTWAARGHFTTYPGSRGHPRRVADEYGIRAHVRFDCTVTGIEWDEGTGGWTLETSRARQAQKSSS